MCAAALSVALAGCVLITDLAGLTYGWTSPMILTLAAGTVVALIAFVLIEQRAAEATLPLRLARDRTFVLVAALGLSVGFAPFGSVTYRPLLLQFVKGSSPSASGLEITPMMTGTLIPCFAVGAVVAPAGFFLSWFLPERPPRETVAAYISSVGKEAGESLAMAAPGDPSSSCSAVSRSSPTVTCSAPMSNGSPAAPA
jgi:hypothetical protein